MEGRSAKRPSCRIRKRGCSSSSSSSLGRRYRFKRAILAGMSVKSPNQQGSSQKAEAFSKCSPPDRRNGSRVDKETVAVSARQLAAALWETNPIHSMHPRKDFLSHKEEAGCRTGGAKKFPTFPLSSPDPCVRPFSERKDRFQEGTRQSKALVPQKPQKTEYEFKSLGSIGGSSKIKMETHSRGRDRSSGAIPIESHLKDARNSLETSKELVKVLSHWEDLDDKHTLRLVSALYAELDHAALRVDQLIHEKGSRSKEAETLLKRFMEEKASWKKRERQKVQNAIACVSEELKGEKKLRIQTERLNKKLGTDLIDTKMALSKALKGLDSEKRAKEVLQQMCDELARGINDDVAEVESLKRELERIREEAEREREMLRIADVLKEESVQMKLLEAKYDYEEKNAALERLRSDLEAFLRTEIAERDGSSNLEKIEELQAYLRNTCGYGSERDKANAGSQKEPTDETDLHSIELTMENDNVGYKWSYACDDNNKIDTIHRQSSTSSSFDRESDIQTRDFDEEIIREKSIRSLRDYICSSNKFNSSGVYLSPTRRWNPSSSGADFPASQGDGYSLGQEGPTIQPRA